MSLSLSNVDIILTDYISRHCASKVWVFCAAVYFCKIIFSLKLCLGIFQYLMYINLRRQMAKNGRQTKYDE